MGLLKRGGPGDGYCRGTQVRMQVAGGGLPQGILDKGDKLHHGEG